MPSFAFLSVSLLVLSSCCSALSQPPETDQSGQDEYNSYKDPQLSQEDAVQYSAMQLEYFAYQAQFDPLSGQSAVELPSCPTGKMAPPDKVPSDVNPLQRRSILGKLLRPLRGIFQRPGPPQRPRLQLCNGLPINQAHIAVFFHWHGNDTAASYNITEDRLQKQVDLMNTMTNPHGVSFVYAPQLRSVVDSDIVSPYIVQDNAWRRAETRVPYPFNLNVWLVDKPTTNSSGAYSGLQGISTFPWQESSSDGIVLNHECLLGEGGNFNNPDRNVGGTLIHEVGHWLGLYHTFTDSGASCDEALASDAAFRAVDDQLSDTPLTPGFKKGSPDPRFSCVQNVCDNSGGFALTGTKYINNFMSYSECGGMVSSTDRTLTSTAFTPQQRARIYASWMFWRGGGRKALTTCPAPPPNRPSKKMKRETFSSLAASGKVQWIELEKREDIPENITFLPTRSDANFVTLQDPDVLEKLQGEVLFCVPDDHSVLTLDSDSEDPPSQDPSPGDGNVSDPVSPVVSPGSVTRPVVTPTPGGPTPGTPTPGTPTPDTVNPGTPTPGAANPDPGSPVTSSPTSPTPGITTPGADSAGSPTSDSATTTTTSPAVPQPGLGSHLYVGLKTVWSCGAFAIIFLF